MANARLWDKSELDLPQKLRAARGPGSKGRIDGPRLGREGEPCGPPGIWIKS